MLAGGDGWFCCSCILDQALVEGALVRALEQLGGHLGCDGVWRIVHKRADMVAAWAAQGWDSG